MDRPPKDWSDRWSYAGLALPMGSVGVPLYLYMPDFYAGDLGLSLTVLGSLLLFLRLFDACQDPFLGYVSDRWAGAQPRIRRFMSLLGFLCC